MIEKQFYNYLLNQGFELNFPKRAAVLICAKATSRGTFTDFYRKWIYLWHWFPLIALRGNKGINVISVTKEFVHNLIFSNLHTRAVQKRVE